MNNNLQTSFAEISLFMIVWYLLTITTYGIWVPSGLFLPGIIIGCAFGQFYAQIIDVLFPETYAANINNQSYKIMGASAMLGGYTRLTYSLCVIMLETTQSINFFIPILFSVLTSVSVGNYFNRGLYEVALRAKNVPLLRNNVPDSQTETTAFSIMT
jgi:H+/Cl- antiporter ClcA